MSVAWRLGASLATVLLAAACTGTSPVASPSADPVPTPQATPGLASPSPGATSSPEPTAQPTPTDSPAPAAPISVALVGNEAVLRPSELGDYGATLAATYFLDGATRHAYVLAFGDSPSNQRAFHLTSVDGVSWEVDPRDPFAELGLELGSPGAVPGTVMETEVGWVMYLWGVPAAFPPGAVLWRATADDPNGPWVADSEPIIEIGERGEWDDLGLDFPAVVEADDGYLMLYGANGTTHRDAALIGYATSADGVTWERGPGPVLDPETCGSNQNDFIAQPRLLRVDDGYLALFLAGSDIAAATSPDGIEWTCLGDAPVLLGSQLPTGERVHSFATAEVDGSISLLIESLVDGGSELRLGEMSLP